MDYLTFEFFRKKLENIEKLLIEIKLQEIKIMGTEQDLQAAVAQLGQDVMDNTTKVAAIHTKMADLIAKIANAGSIPDADIQSLTAIHASLVQANTDLQVAIDQPA